jgi:hypothetical protein
MLNKIIDWLLKSSAVLGLILVNLVGLILIVITVSYFIHSLGIW